MNLDQMFYLVIDRSDGELFTLGGPIGEMDRKKVVRDIADGQYNEVCAVIEFNPIERTSRVVTQGIIASVADIWAESGERLTQWKLDLIADHLGAAEAAE